MIIRNLSPGGYAANCYLLAEGESAVLIDCSVPYMALSAALADIGAHLQGILLTHGHFDHMLSLAEIRGKTGAPVYLHEADKDLPGDPHANCFSVFFGFDRSYPAPDRLLHDGDTVTFDAVRLRVLHTPGHTPGSSVFLTDDTAFTGDTLFCGSYGRCDLPGGDFPEMRKSLNRLAALPPDIRIFPGHGESATLKLALDPILHKPD